MTVANSQSQARDSKLTIEDMAGGTFTISNGGVFGSLMGTPIINLPQTGVLGLHAIKEKPVAINGKVEIRPVCAFSPISSFLAIRSMCEC
jgi:2-oxoglutarate dehydrogenase E2 component (dihydrolipoamide succinyltransferase)